MINYRPVFSKKWRILIWFISGFSFYLFHEIILSLVYRNYNPAKNTAFLFTSLLVSAIAVSIITFTNKQYLNKNDWRDKLLDRALFQFFIAFVSLSFFINAAFYYSYKITWDFIPYNRILIVNLLLLFFCGIYVMIDAALFLLNRWRFSLAEIEEMKKENIAARFETLKSQINPHFLFNSLNTLVALIFENQNLAADYTRQLSTVYRFILENKNKDLIEIGEEKTFMESYFRLLEIRFAEKLKIEIKIGEIFNRSKIVPMSLQMLIENALKHNIVSSQKPLSIDINVESVSAKNTGEKTVQYLVVKNSLQPKTNPEYSSGIGLENIQKRYEFFTPEKVIVEKTATEFIVKLPILKP